MSIRFVFNEGINNLQRARLATVLSISAISLSALSLSIFALVFYNFYSISESWKEKIEIDIYLSDELSGKEKLIFRNEIKQFSGLDTLYYIDKERAANQFVELFEQDAVSILGYNPLPESIHITVDLRKVEYARFTDWIEDVGNRDGVITVDYARKQLEAFNKYIYYFYWISGGLGLLISIVGIFLIYNTVKLSIQNKNHIIQTMRLVGATEKLIRRPFLVQGIIEGFIGGLFSVGITWLLINLFHQYTDVTIIFEILWLTGALLLSVFLGLLGGRMAIRRYLPQRIEW
jgi:cell division transport system permease protein